MGSHPRRPKKGATSTIDSGDDRMQQTPFINGAIWGEITSSVTIGGNATVRAGAAWFSVDPTLRNNHIGTSNDGAPGLCGPRGQQRNLPGITRRTRGPR
jgi:hypothetical protein